MSTSPSGKIVQRAVETEFDDIRAERWPEFDGVFRHRVEGVGRSSQGGDTAYPGIEREARIERAIGEEERHAFPVLAGYSTEVPCHGDAAVGQAGELVNPRRAVERGHGP